LVSTIQAAVAPTPFAVCGGQLAPRLGFQQQWFNFGLADSGTVTVINPLTGTPQNVNLNTFDFSVSTVFADLTWRRNNWLLTLGADARWLLDSGNYNQFYREFVPRWTIEREFPLTQKTGLAIGYDGDYRDTQTQSPPAGVGENYNDRTDHSLYVVGSWRLCRYAVLQPFYRFEYSHYTRVSRDDFLNSFGLALYCPVTKNVTLRAFVGYDNLNTDGQFAQNYEMLDAGGGLNLFIRF
ncbi:MAG: hypothetical protein KGR98_08210, partial [Verrucomicrobia bacterium]|nr:hypothetical protein [Verrucomicrobiota bacterium]